MQDLDALRATIEREARREPFPIDEAIYKQASRDPLVPILCAGSLDALWCSIGRDLGRDEVLTGEPQIGAGGRLVRSGFYRAETGREPPKDDRRLETVLDRVLLTNLVPYKPPGNKAYSAPVRRRFRPFLLELLVRHWNGDRIITLGTEAFQWFGPYLPEGESEAFWAREDRYEAELLCTLVQDASDGRPAARKVVTLCPLPHPSPLNQRWYGQFPSLLDRRIAAG